MDSENKEEGKSERADRIAAELREENAVPQLEALQRTIDTLLRNVDEFRLAYGGAAELAKTHAVTVQILRSAKQELHLSNIALARELDAVKRKQDELKDATIADLRGALGVIDRVVSAEYSSFDWLDDGGGDEN